MTKTRRTVILGSRWHTSRCCRYRDGEVAHKEKVHFFGLPVSAKEVFISLEYLRFVLYKY